MTAPHRLFLVVGPILLQFAGCTVGHRIGGWEGLKRSDKITVLPLKDHASDDPEDSTYTGRVCQEILCKYLEKRTGCKVDQHVPMAYDPQRGYTRSQAVAIAADRGSDYVLFGDCIKFYTVAPMTFRPDRGGIAVEIARVSDGELVYRARKVRRTVTNFETPKDALKSVARSLAGEVRARRR